MSFELRAVRGRVIHPILCIAMYRCIDCIAVYRCIALYSRSHALTVRPEVRANIHRISDVSHTDVSAIQHYIQRYISENDTYKTIHARVRWAPTRSLLPLLGRSSAA